MILSYRYRLLPTRAQHRALADTLESQRILYNAALEERIGAYRATGKGRSYQDQCKALTEWRQSDPEGMVLPSNLQRWTLRRLDDAFQAFFRRAKARGGKAGYPRFRGAGWWRSFGFNEFSGIRFDGRRLRFRGLPGGVRVHLHRPLPDSADIRSCTFTRDGRGWHVSLQAKVDCPTPIADDRPAIGIDVGLSSLAALSSGELIPNPRVARRAEAELRRRQRHMARCKRGSAGRRKAKARVAAVHRRIADSRSTYLHQVSARIANHHSLIAVEKLNVKGMAAGMLAKGVHDAAWGKLQEMLRYKAERAGARLIEVDPRGTSQECSGCGAIVRKTLADRVHACSCGLTLDRDVNAARVILARSAVGVVPDVVRNVADCGRRVPGNISLEGISN